jgi:hypothetical protein
MGIKTPKYFKALSIVDATGQEHHGILVERIHDSFMVKPGWEPLKEGYVSLRFGQTDKQIMFGLAANLSSHAFSVLNYATVKDPSVAG